MINVILIVPLETIVFPPLSTYPILCKYNKDMDTHIYVTNIGITRYWLATILN